LNMFASCKLSLELDISNAGASGFGLRQDASSLMFVYFAFMLSPDVVPSALFPTYSKMFNNSQKRSTESPMDWEWQTQGPTDPNSPFMTQTPKRRFWVAS